MAHVTGMVVSSLGFREVSIAQSKGMSQSTPRAIVTPTHTRLKSLVRALIEPTVMVRGGLGAARYPRVSSCSDSLLLAPDDGEPAGGHDEHEDEEER